jgi:hypothetical protein
MGLGPSELEVIQQYHSSHSAPMTSALERQIIEDHRRLMSGEVFAEQARRIAERGSLAAEALRIAQGYGGREELLRMAESMKAHSLAEAIEKVAAGGSAALAIQHAAEELQFAEAARVADRFTTLDKLIQEQADWAATFEQASGLSGSAAIASAIAAMGIREPWIELVAPERALAGFGRLSEIGRAIAGMRDDYLSSSARLDELLGRWAPPPEFAMWDTARRRAEYGCRGRGHGRRYRAAASGHDPQTQAARESPSVAPGGEEGLAEGLHSVHWHPRSRARDAIYLD